MRHVQIDISRKLDDKEWNTLRAFCEKANRLGRTKLVASGESYIHGRFQYDVNKGANFSAALPPEEQVAEFLMAFRFFYLQNETTNFLKTLSILGRHSKEHEEARLALKSYRNQWDKALFKEAIQITYNNTKITANLLIDLWFNAHYFHSDIKKIAELEELKGVVSEPFAKFMLLDSTYTATKLIFKLNYGLRGIVQKRFSS